MKTGIRTILTHKVHYLLFALACLLLAAVALSAKLMTDDVISATDHYLNDASSPLLVKAQI